VISGLAPVASAAGWTWLLRRSPGANALGNGLVRRRRPPHHRLNRHPKEEHVSATATIEELDAVLADGTYDHCCVKSIFRVMLGLQGCGRRALRSSPSPAARTALTLGQSAAVTSATPSRGWSIATDSATTSRSLWMSSLASASWYGMQRWRSVCSTLRTSPTDIPRAAGTSTRGLPHSCCERLTQRLAWRRSPASMRERRLLAAWSGTTAWSATTDGPAEPT
jgi:hypothetical protein